MRGLGILMLVVGVVLMLARMIMGFTTSHLTRPHDLHRFMLWMAVGLVLAIIGGILVRKGDQED